jgi:hypothetical protein
MAARSHGASSPWLRVVVSRLRIRRLVCEHVALWLNGNDPLMPDQKGGSAAGGGECRLVAANGASHFRLSACREYRS